MRLFAAVILTSAAAALGFAATAGAAPANDDFAAAKPIDGALGSRAANSNGATKEAGEPNHAGNAGGRSVWFTWTAPETATFVFSTYESSFDTLLGIYTGSAADSLTEVASNDDEGFGSQQSLVVFQAVEGTTYVAALDGFGGKSGRYELSWWRGQANDLFASRVVLDGVVGSMAGSNRGATVEASESIASEAYSSVWFEWTAPADGRVKFRTAEIDFDTVLAVYEGDSLEALSLAGENDDDFELRTLASFVGFEAIAGTSYKIKVAGWSGSEGSFVLLWSPLLLGTPGPDRLVGTSGTEEIRGLGGRDVLLGLGGDDVLVGGAGNDKSVGGPGADVLLDKAGLDVLLGGPGADVLDVRDGRTGDRLDGGGGRDACRRDPGDVRRRCP